VPWEPYPGAGGGYEIKSKVRLPTESGELTKIVKGKGAFVPRRLRIKKEDLEKFGFTTGCPGCRAANNGSISVGHSEERRERITEGDERITRENERWFEHLTQEENRMKRRSTYISLLALA
jgi:hypothetical protein